MRIEDIDPPREVAGAADAILNSLEAHGLRGDGDVRYQRDSAKLHDAAIARLIADGHAYFCQCARRKLIANGHARRYPGTCRERGLQSGALRVRVNDTPITVIDRWQPERTDNLADAPGDFIIRRRDGLVAYQLAVVVDDADQGITDIVRGIDLHDSTARQIWLQRLLGFATPRYAHFPVLIDADGNKLSKQTGASELEDGDAAQNLALALNALGLVPPANVRGGPVSEQIGWAQAHYAKLDLMNRQSLRVTV